MVLQTNHFIFILFLFYFILTTILVTFELKQFTKLFYKVYVNSYYSKIGIIMSGIRSMIIIVTSVQILSKYSENCNNISISIPVYITQRLM